MKREFAIVLPDTDLQTAAERAEEIRRALDCQEIVQGPYRIRVTASSGVVQSEPNTEAGSSMKAVDAAMYAAKAAGRNRVVLAPWNAAPARV